MSTLGLAVAGMAALTAPVAAQAVPLGSKMRSESCLPTRSSTTAIRCRPASRRFGASSPSSADGAAATAGTATNAGEAGPEPAAPLSITSD